MPAMSIFNRPVTRKQLAWIADMPESTFYRRLKEMNLLTHRHNFSPKEAEEILIALGYRLESETLRRALEITGQGKRLTEIDRD